MIVSQTLSEFDFEELLKESSDIFKEIHLKSLSEQSKHADPDFKRIKISKYICEVISDCIRNKPFREWTLTPTRGATRNDIMRAAFTAFHRYKIASQRLASVKFCSLSMRSNN